MAVKSESDSLIGNANGQPTSLAPFSSSECNTIITTRAFENANIFPGIVTVEKVYHYKNKLA